MRFCFIACDHGLGHTRRVVAVCRELKRRTGSCVTILASKKLGKKFGWDVWDFETKTTRKGLTEGHIKTCHWHKRLPDLDGYDVVVSDNLPEILTVRHDALLMGSFLWHLSIDRIDPRYRQTAEALLAEYSPTMIGSGLFASKALQRATRFVDVGLFQEMTLPKNPKTDLLIACGLSDDCLEETTGATERLAKVSNTPFRAVHVEPRALPKTAPKWMIPADFSADMYSRLAAAAVRPGAGTITELLQGGARIFCFYEKGNGELRHNARQLERYNLALDCRTADAAVDAALSLGVNGSENPRTDTTLQFDGASRAAAYLATISKGATVS